MQPAHSEGNSSTGKITIPEPTGLLAQPWSPKKLLGMFTVFGPAAIVASLGIGAGETIVVFRAGSWARYDLLWVVLLACLVKGVFLTYLLGRYTAVSGEYIGHRLVKLPGPRGWLLILLIVIELALAPLVWAAIAKPCGVLFCFLLQNALPESADQTVCENALTIAFLALACSVGLLSSFEQLEKQQLVICGILVCGTIAGTLMVSPDMGQAVLGSLRIGYVPRTFPSWTPDDARHYSPLTIATIFGYVGGSAMTYIAYSNWVAMHGWGITGHKQIDVIRGRAAQRSAIDYLPEGRHQVRRMRRLITPIKWDTAMGALVTFIVAGTFMVAGAAVLYPMFERGEIDEGLQGWSLLTDQAHIWRAIHPWLVWVYYVCVIAALWGTLQALPETYARVTHEFLQAVWPRLGWDCGPMRAGICVYLFVFTAIIVWSGVSFDMLTQIVGFLVSNFALALVMFAALYLNFKLPRAYRTRWPMLVGSVLSAIILSIFAVVSGWGLAVKCLAGG